MIKLIAVAALLMVSTSVAAQPQPLARFEHVYTVLDEQTAKAIASSPYLRDFCGSFTKTTVGEGGHYHGIYLQGRENYVELFGPTDLNLDGPRAAVGLVGIGLATEQMGGLERMKPAVEKNGLSVELRVMQKTFGSRTVDWFKGLAPRAVLDGDTEKTSLPTVEIFASEFIPSYFDVPEANKPPSLRPDDVITLERYSRRDYAHRLMENISGVTLALTREDWPMLRAMLLGGGFDVTQSGKRAQASGDIALTFLFVPRQQVGLREVDFNLNSKPGTPHVEVLGRSRLVVGPSSTATWTFEPTSTE